MKIRSTLALAVIALAASSTMAAPAFARSHRHHGHRSTMTTHASPAKQAAPKIATAKSVALPAPAPHN